MLRRSLLPLALLLALAVPFAPARATQLLQVTYTQKSELARLQSVAPEAQDEGAIPLDNGVEFPADPGRADQLRALGFEVKVVTPDLESFYASRLSRDNNYGAYHTLAEAITTMDSLAAAYPGIMSAKFSIGTTLEGRSIWVYKISDNPNIDEDEPEVFFDAYIHAREAITVELLINLTRYLVRNYGTDMRATGIVNTREIFIEPVVNPDGVEYNHTTDPSGGGMWRKNLRDNGDGSSGVDLNRNFGYDWGYDDIGSSPSGYDDTYRGTGPFSEPETQAIRDFINSRHFKIAVSNHSYGGYELYPWSRTSIHCPDNDVFFALGRMRRITSGYTMGASWEVLYTTNGGSTDWGYGDVTSRPKIMSMVTETGTQTDGFWPAENRIGPLCALSLEKNLRVCELADNPFRIMPPGLAVVISPDTISTTSTLTWTVPNPDADNPATAWNLVEATGLTVGQDNLEGTSPSRWTADQWTWSTSKYHSTNHSYFSGNTSYLHSVLISKRGHRVLAGEQLKFWTWYNMESGYDYGYVEVATDARNFVPLAGSITTNSDPNDRNLGNGINGSTSSAWVQGTFSLASYVGQTIWIRFRYNADGGVNSGGWYVDDIEPSDLFSGETTLGSGLSVPEYAFTNHAEGTFYYLVQSVDADGDVSIWSAPKREVFRVMASGVDSGPADAWKGLQQIGSNPFSTSTRLRWTLPASARAGDGWSLSVHDVTGRLVENLGQGTLSGASLGGRILEAYWAPAALPSGMYLVRLHVGPQTSQQRVVYLK